MSHLKRKAYKKLLAPMQLELVDMARWLRHTNQRALVLVEGRDTAGKGGVIRPSPAISAHASVAWWRCPSPTTAKARSGISSAM